MEQQDKLNLGCGQFPKKGYVNLDIYPDAKADIFHDLNKFPYPFKDNSFSLIEADHVLEHLHNPLQVIKECHRILMQGGKLIIKAPHFSRGFSHSDHKRGFDITLPYYFNLEFKGGYVGVEYKLKKMRLMWFAQPCLKKEIFPILYYPLIVISWILDFLANICPACCSRIWCFWVGGFEEIEFYFQKE